MRQAASNIGNLDHYTRLTTDSLDETTKPGGMKCWIAGMRHWSAVPGAQTLEVSLGSQSRRARIIALVLSTSIFSNCKSVATQLANPKIELRITKISSKLRLPRI